MDAFVIPPKKKENQPSYVQNRNTRAHNNIVITISGNRTRDTKYFLDRSGEKNNEDIKLDSD